MERVTGFYNKTIDGCSEEINLLRKKIHTAGTVRLLLFIVAIANIWFIWDKGWLTVSIITLLYTVPFLALMVYHDKLSRIKSRKETLVLLCRNELKGITDYDFSAFDGAAEMIDGEHSFSLDLDVFGEHSVFQSINRTVTFMGKELLSGWFISPLCVKDDIIKRQEAVKELSLLTGTRQDFYVEGALHRNKTKSNDGNNLSRLSNMPAAFAGSTVWKLAVWTVPIAWIIMFAGLASGYIPFGFFGLMFIVSSCIAYLKVGKINRLYSAVNRMENILKVYSSLMKTVENTDFSSDILRGIKGKLHANSLTASQAIKQLSAHIGTLDQRGTLSGILLNIFTLREIRASIAIETWNSKHGAEIKTWLEALASFDALSSLAGFAFNHPDYTYPHITDSYFNISGEEVGHPLIRRDACVKNSINIDATPMFIIITGANMAGKSTYLRTIGVNYLLACTGTSVCAKSLKLYPAKLFTSLRTSDSLASNESYFFAELKRLKAIIDCLHQKQELFIILDEILKGTNSIDKQKGSFALVKQLVAQKACGIIATHDLALGALEKEFPEHVRNFRFEADIIDNKLYFNYQLREGIAVNMNATFLMKQMGITLE